MKLLNELHTVHVTGRRGERIEAVVRRRGIDAHRKFAYFDATGTQAAMFQRLLPEEVVVTRADGRVERASIRASEGPSWLPYVAAPALALIVGRMIKRREMRVRRRT